MLPLVILVRSQTRGIKVNVHSCRVFPRLAVETYPICHGTWQHVSTTFCLGYGLGASPSHHMEDGMMWRWGFFFHTHPSWARKFALRSESRITVTLSRRMISSANSRVNLIAFYSGAGKINGHLVWKSKTIYITYLDL